MKQKRMMKRQNLILEKKNPPGQMEIISEKDLSG